MSLKPQHHRKSTDHRANVVHEWGGTHAALWEWGVSKGGQRGGVGLLTADHQPVAKVTLSGVTVYNRGSSSQSHFLLSQKPTLCICPSYYTTSITWSTFRLCLGLRYFWKKCCWWGFLCPDITAKCHGWLGFKMNKIKNQTRTDWVLKTTYDLPHFFFHNCFYPPWNSPLFVVVLVWFVLYRLIFKFWSYIYIIVNTQWIHTPYVCQ